MSNHTKELKPCPICGGDARIETEYDADDIKWYFVECCKCRLRTRGNWTTECCGIFLQERRDEWNTRASDKQRDELVLYLKSSRELLSSVEMISRNNLLNLSAELVDSIDNIIASVDGK